MPVIRFSGFVAMPFFRATSVLRRGHARVSVPDRHEDVHFLSDGSQEFYILRPMD